MILINTRPKDLSGKINELCDQEGIGLQNIYLSKIIPIEIDTDNGVYKEIFENLDKYSNFIFTSQAAVKNGAKLIKLKSKLLNKKHKFFAVGDSTKQALTSEGYMAIVPDNKSSDGLAEMIKNSFPGKSLVICGDNTNMNLQKKLSGNSDEIRCYKLEYSKKSIDNIISSPAIILIYNYLTFEFIFKNLNQDSLKNKFFVVASERIKSKIIDLSLGFNIKVFVSKSALDEDMIIKAKEFI